MNSGPQPTRIVSALSAVTPFTGPESLERRFGRPFRLRLGANESLFGPSPIALEAMQAAAARGFLYGDPEGWDLRSAIASRFSVGLENVCLGAGIDDLLMLLARAFVAPGEAVLTSLGGYPTLDYVVAGGGGRIERVPYRDDRVDLPQLAGVAQEIKPKLVYLANPDNPSGSRQNAEQVAALRAAMPAESLLVLDEAYADFVPSSDLPPIDVQDPGVVRLRTFSKAYGMAGLRVGFAIAHEEHVRTLNKIRLHFGVNSVAQAGAIASLQDDEHLRYVVQETDAGRRLLSEAASRLGMPALLSRTNFVCLDCRTRERAEALLTALLNREVFVRKPIAPPLDRCIRVTIGRQEDVAAFLEELEAVAPSAERE